MAEDRFISYTGDRAERIALRFYNLHPIKAKRLEISSSNVKELLYREALEQVIESSKESWQKMVPKNVVNIIMENWKTVEKYAQSADKTIKIFGMKFPEEGILN